MQPTTLTVQINYTVPSSKMHVAMQTTTQSVRIYGPEFKNACGNATNRIHTRKTLEFKIGMSIILMCCVYQKTEE